MVNVTVVLSGLGFVNFEVVGYVTANCTAMLMFKVMLWYMFLLCSCFRLCNHGTVMFLY